MRSGNEDPVGCLFLTSQGGLKLPTQPGHGSIDSQGLTLVFTAQPDNLDERLGTFGQRDSYQQNQQEWRIGAAKTVCQTHGKLSL